jgi:hypothetical protein
VVVWADVDGSRGGELGAFGLCGGSMNRLDDGRVCAIVEGKALVATVAVAIVEE